jgi:hypothetical protein
MRLPQSVYEEYKQRRTGIIHALTADVRTHHESRGSGNRSLRLPADPYTTGSTVSALAGSCA